MVPSVVDRGAACEHVPAVTTRSPDARVLPAPMLAVADALALLAFVLAGLSRHSSGITVSGVARDAGPILVAWIVLSPLLRTYSRPGWRTLLVTWAVAVPAGVVIRTLWLGHPSGVRLLTFLMVTMVFTALFLAAGRAAAWWWGGRRLNRPGARRPE